MVSQLHNSGRQGGGTGISAGTAVSSEEAAGTSTGAAVLTLTGDRSLSRYEAMAAAADAYERQVGWIVDHSFVLMASLHVLRSSSSSFPPFACPCSLMSTTLMPTTPHVHQVLTPWGPGY